MSILKITVVSSGTETCHEIEMGTTAGEALAGLQRDMGTLARVRVRCPNGSFVYFNPATIESMTGEVIDD